KVGSTRTHVKSATDNALAFSNRHGDERVLLSIIARIVWGPRHRKPGQVPTFRVAALPASPVTLDITCGPRGLFLLDGALTVLEGVRCRCADRAASWTGFNFRSCRLRPCGAA